MRAIRYKWFIPIVILAGLTIHSEAYKASSLSTFIFHLIHPNPIEWNGLVITYSPDMIYGEIEKGKLMFYHIKADNKGILKIYPTSQVNITQILYNAHTIEHPYTLLDFKTMNNNITYIHYKNTDTNIEHKLYTLIDKGISCEFIGTDSIYQSYHTTLESAVFGEKT